MTYYTYNYTEEQYYTMKEASEILIKANKLNQIDNYKFEAILYSLSYLLKPATSLDSEEILLAVKDVLPKVAVLTKKFAAYLPNFEKVISSLRAYSLLLLKINAYEINDDKYFENLFMIHNFIKKVFNLHGEIPVAERTDADLFVEKEYFQNYPEYTFAQYLFEKGFLSRSIKSLALLQRVPEITKMLNFYAQYLSEDYSNKVFSLFSQLDISGELLDIYSFLIRLQTSPEQYKIICDTYYSALIQLFQILPEKCIEHVEGLLSENLQGEELDYLNNFFDETEYDEDDAKQVKTFAETFMYLMKHRKKTEKDMFETLEKHQSLIPYMVPLMSNAPESIIELLAEKEPKKACDFIADKFDGSETKFKDEKKMLNIIIKYGSDVNIEAVKKVIDSYDYLLEELIYDMETKEYEEATYLINLCKILEASSSFFNFSHLADVILNSLDSIDILSAFGKYEFLPITDKALFVELCPNVPLLYDVLMRRKIYPEVALKSEKYIEYAKEAFEKTEDPFFAASVAQIGIPNSIQTFVDKLNSIDFLIDAIENDQQATLKSLEGIDLSGVVADNYEVVVKDTPAFLHVTHKATKYHFNFDSQMKEKINSSPVPVACYYLDCALEHASDEWWNNYDIPFSCKGTDGMESQILILSRKRAGTLTQEEASEALKVATKEGNMELFNIVFSSVNKQTLSNIEINDLKPKTEEMWEILLMKIDVNKTNKKDLIQQVPISLLEQILDEVEEKDDDFYQAVEERLSKIVASGDKNDFEKGFVSILNSCEGENAARIAIKTIFSNIPFDFRTKEVMSCASKCFSYSPDLLKEKLQNTEIVQTFNNSPFISAFGEIIPFIIDPKSSFAEDARKAKLCMNPSHNYSSLEQIEDMLPKEFEINTLQITGFKHESFYDSFNHISTRTASSVKEAIEQYMNEITDVDDNGNEVTTYLKLTELPDYLAIFPQKNKDMVIDKEIDLSDYMLPGKESKTWKLVSFVGQDEKTKEYLLNKGIPVLILYSAVSVPESKLFASLKDNEQTNVTQCLKDIDWGLFPKDQELATLLMTKFGISSLLEKYCNEEDFVIDLFENNFVELVESENTDVNLLKKMASVFPDPELLFVFSLDIVNNQKYADSLIDIFIAAGITTDVIIEFLTTNEIDISNFMKKVKTDNIELSEEAIKTLIADENTKHYVLEMSNDKYIKYFLPIKDEDSFKSIEKYASHQYAAKILIANKDKEMATNHYKTYSDIPEYVGFINQLHNDSKRIIDMLNDPSRREEALELIKEKYNGFEIDSYFASSLEKMIIAQENNVYPVYAIEGHEKQFDNTRITLAIIKKAIMNVNNYDVLMKLLLILQKCEHFNYSSILIDFTDLVLQEPTANALVLFNFISSRVADISQLIIRQCMVIYEIGATILSEEQVEFVAKDYMLAIKNIRTDKIRTDSIALKNPRTIKYFIPLINSERTNFETKEFISTPIFTITNRKTPDEYIKDYVLLSDLAAAKYDKVDQKELSNANIYLYEIIHPDLSMRIAQVVEKHRPAFLHCFAHFLVVHPEEIKWIFTESFLKQFSSDACLREFVYLLKTLYEHNLKPRYIANYQKNLGTLLYKVFVRVSGTNDWTNLSAVMKLLICLFNDEETLAQMGELDFSMFFSSLSTIPNEDKELGYVYELTEKICRTFPDSCDIENCLEFFNSFSFTKEEAEKLEIVRVIIENSPEVITEVLVAEFSIISENAKDVPELEPIVAKIIKE